MLHTNEYSTSICSQQLFKNPQFGQSNKSAASGMWSEFAARISAKNNSNLFTQTIKHILGLTKPKDNAKVQLKCNTFMRKSIITGFGKTFQVTRVKIVVVGDNDTSKYNCRQSSSKTQKLKMDFKIYILICPLVMQKIR